MGVIQTQIIKLLRWSEKYTKTDMVYLASGSFWLTIGAFVTGATSFILSLAFANLLPAEVYGTYKYVLSLASTFSAFTLTGLSTSVIEAVSRGKEGVLRRAFWTNITWSCPAAIVAVGVASYYFVQSNITLGVSFLIIAFFQPLITSTTFGDSFLTGKRAFRYNAAFYTASNLVPAIALVVVMLFSKSALLVITVYFLSNLLTAAAMYALVLRYCKPNNEGDETSITYGKHLSLMNIFGSVVDNIDKILVFHYLGAAQLAVYSFALALPSQSKLITKSISTLIFPKFAARDEKELHRGMGEKVLRFFLLGAVMAIIYILIAPYAYHIFYPKYTDAIFLSQVFALSYICLFAAPTGTFLSAKRRVRPQYIMNVTSGTFQIVAVTVGIYFAGLMGLILARVATRFMGSLLSMFFYYAERNAQQNS